MRDKSVYHAKEFTYVMSDERGSVTRMTKAMTATKHDVIITMTMTMITIAMI